MSSELLAIELAIAYPAPTRRRYLHLGHFAFMRAAVQGLPIAKVWDRYLGVEGEHTDARVVRSTMAWMRAELVAAAKRESRPGLARLLRLEVDRLADTEPKLPSLATFAEEVGLQDEREADQLEAYEGRYGAAARRAARRARLLKRQLAALRWLEEQVAQRPAAGDAVAAWLRPDLAARLGQAGIFTLAQLVGRVNGLGLNWAHGIETIGEIKSRRIVQWLDEHAASIGMALGAHTRRPRGQLDAAALTSIVAPAADVRPLEKLVVPAALDGRAGAYRLDQQSCLLAADNDYDAILAWLAAKRGPMAAPGQLGPGSVDPRTRLPTVLSHTQRAYRKEAERFLLWATLERRKALSSMTAEDCVAYRGFIADPQPRSRWCGSRSRQRWSPLWRPFEGPLTAAAQRQAITILKSLWGFLVAQNYLRGNPWAALAVPRAARSSTAISRSLTRAQWLLVRDHAERAGDHSAARRLRLALTLLYATGLRASEVTSARVGDLRRVEYPSNDGGEAVQGWMLRVLGKGGKLREVPVPDDTIAELSAYLASRGLAPDLGSVENSAVFILGQASDKVTRAANLGATAPDPTAPISAATLYGQLKRHFGDCADELVRSGEALAARKLRSASTHWLRHTHASQAIASGMPIQVAQQNLGHASLATTTIYVTSEDRKRLLAARRFWEDGAR